MVVAEVLTVVVLDHLAMTQHQVWGRGIAEQGSGVGGQCGWAVLVGGVDGQCGWAVLVGGVVGGQCSSCPLWDSLLSSTSWKMSSGSLLEGEGRSVCVCV